MRLAPRLCEKLEGRARAGLYRRKVSRQPFAAFEFCILHYPDHAELVYIRLSVRYLAHFNPCDRIPQSGRWHPETLLARISSHLPNFIGLPRPFSLCSCARPSLLLLLIFGLMLRSPPFRFSSPSFSPVVRCWQAVVPQRCTPLRLRSCVVHQCCLVRILLFKWIAS
jgi:hypothetical protein